METRGKELRRKMTALRKKMMLLRMKMKRRKKKNKSDITNKYKSIHS